MVFYSGSETTPPCSETVTWIVNTTPHVITESQIEDLKSMLGQDVQDAGGNARGTTGSNEQHSGLPPSQRVWKFSQTEVIDVPPEVQTELDLLWHEVAGIGTINISKQEQSLAGAQTFPTSVITFPVLLAITVII